MSVINLNLNGYSLIDTISKDQLDDYKSLNPKAYRVDFEEFSDLAPDALTTLKYVEIRPSNNNPPFIGFALAGEQPGNETDPWWAILFCPPGIIYNQAGSIRAEVIAEQSDFDDKYV